MTQPTLLRRKQPLNCGGYVMKGRETLPRERNTGRGKCNACADW